MREIPRPYERYRHFKGREYQVLAIAKNEKTMEDMVVYQALYEPYQIYVRELAEFLSAVDKEKYPKAMQKERFALIRDEDGSKAATHSATAHTDVAAEEKKTAEMQYTDVAQNTVTVQRTAETRRAVAVESAAGVQRMPEPSSADGNGVDPVLMRFLDAEDGPEQLKVLEECAGKITEKILTPMELSMGMEPSTASVDERIRNIRNNITTRMKYEIRR
ncbi:MAG: DUF1653 domain-containing protein [Lachnospiraceae bacterium]|nr:DUF1653 domain-containing protein [Lachnospiraceae bacterium]